MAKSGSQTGRVKTFRLNNMNGLMNTVAEENAYLTFDPNANLGGGNLISQIPFEFKNVENWAPINRGGLSKASGFSEYFDTTVTANITGIGRLITSGGTNQFIYSQGTSVYKLVSGTATSVATITSGAYPHFETAYDKLIISDGTLTVQAYDGASTANLAAGGDATALVGTVQTLFYRGRLFAFSATHDTSLLYYSDPNDITAGYAANFINCDVNDGQRITSIAKYFIPGSLEPTILIGKTNSFGLIQGDGSTANPFTYVRIDQRQGIPGFRQIIQFGQDAAYFTQEGIASFKAANNNENIRQLFLSKKVRNQFTSLATTYLDKVFCWFDWKNKRISYAVPTGASAIPNKIWHYDFEVDGIYCQTGFNLTSAFVDTDGTLYHGDDAGKIYQHSPTVFNYNGSRISGILQTPYLDFWEPDYYKEIVHCKVRFRAKGQYNVGIGCKHNYGSVTGTSHTIALTGGQYVWGGGVWTSNPGVYQWGAAPLNVQKFYPGGIFENISFNITQHGTDEPVDFLDMVIQVRYLNLI